MSVWKIIKKSGKDFYNHLFLLGMVSFIWFFLVIPLMYVGIGGIVFKMPIGVIMNLIFVGPLTIAAFDLTNKLIKSEEIGIKDFFRSFAKNFKKGLLAYWISLVILLLLIVDFMFFMNIGNKFLFYLSGIWIYLGIFFMMSQFYFWSLLVEMEDGIFKILKRSFILTLDNLFYSLGIFVMFAFLFVIGLATAGIILAVSFIGFLGILANNATYNLLVKYNIREDFFMRDELN
ncbi:MAG: DUF624 domain-containing protein [Halanaerobiales bacterium]|nr:DUF624 domain-containing protein [Halanaerobiales bacterium]